MKKKLLKINWLLSNYNFLIFPLIFIIIIGSITSILGVSRALISKDVINSAIDTSPNKIFKYLILLILVVLFEIILNTISPIINTYFSNKMNNKIQIKLYSHITYSKWLEQSKYHSINLLTRITNDVAIVTTTLTSSIPNIIILILKLIFSMMALFHLAPSLAIIGIILFPLFCFLSKIFSKKIKELYILLENEESKYRAFIQESIHNTIIVKSFCMEENSIKILDKIQKNKLSISIKRSFIKSLSRLFIKLGSSLSYIIVFCWGCLHISKGISSFGTLTALLQLFNNIQGPFSNLLGSFHQIIVSMAAVERLIEIENMSLEVIYTADCKKESCNLINGNSKEKEFIIFKNVTFSYSRFIPILNDISFSINKGDTIALVGPSGEGKTTLIRLLLSLIEPHKGAIYINKNALLNSFDLKTKSSIEKLNITHRNFIAYVPQGNTLFSGTIEENLRFGNINVTIDDIYEALKNACALDFINKLPNKINTVIGEKGLGLSEGQCQRISIARALLIKKSILILDEATSALDRDTEYAIINTIKHLNPKPTCILITHRPLSLSICNKILELKNGHISVLNDNKVENIIYSKEMVID